MSKWMRVAAFLVAAVVALGIFAGVADGEGDLPAAPLLARTGADLDASVVKVILPGGHGSGVVIGDGTLVLTAAHVADGAPDGQIVVVAQDGTAIDGRVLWVGVADDLALIRIETALPAVQLQCADAPVGSAIEVVGHPNAGVTLDWMHTFGHVGSYDADGMGYWLAPIFYFDAAVMSGSSGGPIFNAAGEVVGIVVGLLGVQSYYGGPPQPFGFNIAVPASRACGALGR